MSGSPARSAYAFEEELNLAPPPHDPFAIPDEDYDSDEYDNAHTDDRDSGAGLPRAGPPSGGGGPPAQNKDDPATIL